MKLQHCLFYLPLLLLPFGANAACTNTDLPSTLTGTVSYKKLVKPAFISGVAGYHKSLRPREKLPIKRVYRPQLELLTPLCLKNTLVSNVGLIFPTANLLPNDGERVSLRVGASQTSNKRVSFEVKGIVPAKINMMSSLGGCKLIDSDTPATFAAKLAVGDEPDLTKNILYPSNFTLQPTSKLCVLHKPKAQAHNLEGVSSGDIYEIPFWSFDVANVPVKFPAYINSELQVRAKLFPKGYQLELLTWRGKSNWPYHALLCYRSGTLALDLSAHYSAHLTYDDGTHKALMTLPYALCRESKLGSVEIVTKLELPIDEKYSHLENQFIYFRIRNDRVVEVKAHQGNEHVTSDW